MGGLRSVTRRPPGSGLSCSRALHQTIERLAFDALAFSNRRYFYADWTRLHELSFRRAASIPARRVTWVYDAQHQAGSTAGIGAMTSEEGFTE